MTTRRQIICFILSALIFSSCAFLADDQPHRVVRIKALADPALRERNPRWDEEVRGLVEAASDYYEKELGIRFMTESTAPWPLTEKIPSTAGILTHLKQDFPITKSNGKYDLIVAFTAERVNYYFGGRGRVDRIGNCHEGLGNYAVIYVSELFHYTGASSEPTIDVVSLIHELGHIFGAEHTKDINSIMSENFDYRSQIDMKNRSMILKNRNCPFAK
jgi:Metallo-peptidase family M12